MLDIVIEARKASIGPGLEVRRILPFRLRRMVGPFIFMDHAGPVACAAAIAAGNGCIAASAYRAYLPLVTYLADR